MVIKRETRNGKKEKGSVKWEDSTEKQEKGNKG